MENRLELLIGQRLAYGFLSRVFHEAPAAELMQTLAADDLFATWPLELTAADGENGLATLQRYFQNWHADDLAALKADYQRLFIGPGHLLAAPWESVYRSPDHLIFGLQTVQVRQAYHRFGLPMPWQHVEPDDHLGLELEFVAHLCGLALGSIDAGDSETEALVTAEIGAFLRDHLLRWAGDCLALVKANAQTDYYRGCAELTEACLRHSAQLYVTGQVELLP